MEPLEGSIDSSADISPFTIAANDDRLPSTSESLRLLQAFLSVSDPNERRRIIADVERIAAMSSERQS